MYNNWWLVKYTNLKSLVSARLMLGVLEREPAVHATFALQESYLRSEFIDIVQYCKSPSATTDRLLNMITEESMCAITYCSLCL